MENGVSIFYFTAPVTEFISDLSLLFFNIATLPKQTWSQCGTTHCPGIEMPKNVQEW